MANAKRILSGIATVASLFGTVIANDPVHVDDFYNNPVSVASSGAPYDCGIQIHCMDLMLTTLIIVNGTFQPELVFLTPPLSTVFKTGVMPLITAT